MKRIIIYIIILKCIKCVESLRRLGFVNLMPNQMNSLTRINTKSLIRTKILNKYNKLDYKNLLFAKNSQSDDLFDCPGFKHIFNQSYVFSGKFEDLGVNNLLSRELDYRKYSLESHKGLKKFMAVVLSAVAVGALYKFATFLKDIIEQQVIELVSSVTVTGPRLPVHRPVDQQLLVPLHYLVIQNTGHPRYNTINTHKHSN